MRLLHHHLEGFDVVTSVNGEDAWNLYQSDFEIRIAILDWMLPLISGLDLCEKIRRFETEAKTAQNLYTYCYRTFR